MVKRSPMRLNQPSQFTEETLKGIVKDIQTGRMPLRERVTVSDDMVTGLRAVISKSGQISLSASYHFGDERPFLKLGELNAPKSDPNYMSIEDAREITKTIKILADHGINVDHEIEGTRRRVLQEVLKRGTKWRPK